MIRNWNCYSCRFKKKRKKFPTLTYLKFGGKNKSPLEMIRENEILINR